MKKLLQRSLFLMMCLFACQMSVASTAEINDIQMQSSEDDVEFYVIGSNVNGQMWALAQEDAKFKDQGNGIYRWEGKVLGTGFKINDGTWYNSDLNIGTYNDLDNGISLNVPFHYYASHDSGNIAFLEFGELHNPVLELDLNNKTITIVRGEPSSYFSWYFVGDFNDWDLIYDNTLLENYPSQGDILKGEIRINERNGECLIALDGWGFPYGAPNGVLNSENLSMQLKRVIGQSDGGIHYSLNKGIYEVIFDKGNKILTLVEKEIYERDDFISDGIYYDIIGPNEVRVGYRQDYSGDITIPETVTFNGKHYTVTAIDNRAFANCENLKSVSFPPSIISIGESAFVNCSGLTAMNLPQDISTIGNNTFKGCTGLTSITIPEHVSSIGASAFENCSRLISITIPEHVSSIGASAFENCSGLSAINLPMALSAISKNTFKGCSGLTSITIPDRVSSIGASAFENCTSLSSMDLPDSTEIVDRSAFDGCLSLSTISLPSTISGIPYFEDCWNLEEVNIKNPLDYGYFSVDGMVIYQGKYEGPRLEFFPKGKKGVFKIPDNILYYIPEYMFYNCRFLTTVIIPQSILSIKSNAFNNCSSLREIQIHKNHNNLVILPDSFINLADDCILYVPEGEREVYEAKELSAFDKIEEIRLFFESNGINYYINDMDAHTVGVAPFAGVQYNSNNYSGDIEIPGQVVIEGIPYTVTSVEPYTFAQQFYLTSVKLPDTVEKIGFHAFQGSGITQVCDAKNVTEIHAYTYDGCQKLTDVKISDSIERIGVDAFRSCPNMTSLELGKSVSFIKGVPWELSFSLNRIEVPEENLTFSSQDGVLFSKDKKLLVSVPRAREGEYIIPESVNIISGYAFGRCEKLESVKLPSSLSLIETHAFYDTPNLSSVYSYAQTPPILEDYVFDFQSQYGNEIWLVGTPNGWDISRSDYNLKKVVIGKNCYYGVFDMPEALRFRLYSELGDWETHCFSASSYYDEIVEFNEFDGGATLEIGLNKSKGIMDFPNFKGGKLTFLVDLDNMKLKIAPGEVEASLLMDDLEIRHTLYVPQGSIEIYSETFGWNDFDRILEIEDGYPDDSNGIEAAYSESIESNGLNVYNLQGIRQNVTTPEGLRNLLPGIYIINGKKVLVK